MSMNRQNEAGKAFAEYWQERGYEKGESQPFWLSLLRDVYGVEQPEKYITFEEQVKIDHTSFIDGMIPATHVLIEQKGKGKDLRKPIKQSDGSLLTPFQQAQRYSAVLPYSQRPRWIITCNFEEFLIYDMEKPNGEPEQILLKDFEKEFYRLQFMVNVEDENIRREMEVSVQAGDLVGILYDEILKQYIDPANPRSLQSLNMLCVRLVFCLYAEDAGIFGSRNLFHDYIKSFEAKDMRRALIDLFKMLDTDIKDRDPYENGLLAEFPYVNGGLFADESIEIPQLNDRVRDLLLRKASEDFDWSAISPTIFGAVFESTLNPETRRSGGMHYTSIENIHKVIDPLFLDELREEFSEIKAIAVRKTKLARLEQFRNKLASLTFLDPACGSGNFLTETYISLRRLENDAIAETTDGQIMMNMMNCIRVSIGQFYGIEINDFAVTVAKTALWIAESQMLKETENIIHMNLDFLPLKSYANIVEGNALRIDWETVVPKNKLNFIMGNPPFIGAQLMSKEQKNDILKIFKGNKHAGVLDYVACWYKLATEYMKDTNIECAFVSTNSICQGEQVSALWKDIINSGYVINFAYQTFNWASESTTSAGVHCVIVGFSQVNRKVKRIYNSKLISEASNINPYLLNGSNVFIDSRTKPICNVPKITKGCQPTDGGHLIIEADEYNDFIAKEPAAEKYIKKLIGAKEFTSGTYRYCLWLVGVSPSEIRKMPKVMERIEKVREMRLNSTDGATRKLADTPTVFRETYNPDNFIVVPSATTKNRKYIPLGFMHGDVISTNLNLIIPDASLFHFGVLTSNVHMAWTRVVCGRLREHYRYSKNIVYNNFPWPTPTDEQKSKIEQTAQAILDARALYPDCSLADLYDELTMPVELRKAHQANDKAVMQAYGFSLKMTESECVVALMQLYEELIKK